MIISLNRLKELGFFNIHFKNGENSCKISVNKNGCVMDKWAGASQYTAEKARDIKDSAKEKVNTATEKASTIKNKSVEKTNEATQKANESKERASQKAEEEKERHLRQQRKQQIKPQKQKRE